MYNKPEVHTARVKFSESLDMTYQCVIFGSPAQNEWDRAWEAMSAKPFYSLDVPELYAQGQSFLERLLNIKEGRGWPIWRKVHHELEQFTQALPLVSNLLDPVSVLLCQLSRGSTVLRLTSTVHVIIITSRIPAVPTVRLVLLNWQAKRYGLCPKGGSGVG